MLKIVVEWVLYSGNLSAAAPSSLSMFDERNGQFVAGKYINGAIFTVDGSNWVSKPSLILKEQLRHSNRVVEQRSRADKVPSSKL